MRLEALIFLDAAGGTGRNLSINLLLEKVRTDWRVALALSLSDNANTSLEAGKLANGDLKLPLILNSVESFSIPYLWIEYLGSSPLGIHIYGTQVLGLNN